MKLLLERPGFRVAIGLVAPILALIWWQSQAMAGGARSVGFAPLQSIGAALVEMATGGGLFRDMTATISRSLFGLAVGGGTGIVLGVAMAIWRPLDRVLNPLLQAIRQVPLMGWLPLLGLWVGTGEKSQLIVVSISAFFPTLLNSYEGVVQVERRLLDVGRVYGFTPFQRFRLILFPAALPMILTGVTQALAFAWIAAIASEILFGVGSGLGVTMGLAQIQQRPDMILVTILATGCAGFAINHLVRCLRRHLLRWQPSAL